MIEHIYRPPVDPAGWTLLLLHGTGGSERSLLPLAEAVAPAWGVLSPRGQVSENGALRFFRRIAEGVFDEEDLVQRAAELAAFVESSEVDLSKLVALGYSNGANMAAALMLLHPHLLAGGALLRPMVPIRPTTLPDLSGKCALALVGSFDNITPPDAGRDLAELLRSAGAEVDLVSLPAGHQLTREDVTHASRWLDAIVAAASKD